MPAGSAYTDDPIARGPSPGPRASHGGRGLRAALAAVLALTVMAVAAPAASAAPWACDNAGYVVQVDAQATGGNTWFQRVDRQPNGTYTLTRLGTLPGAGNNLNALGFRVQDGHMYAWNLVNDNVVRIGRNPATGQATFDPIGVPAGMPANFSTVVGTFLNDGRYFVWGSVAGVGQRGLIIDVTTAPNPTVAAIVVPNYDTTQFAFADFAVNPADGQLYTLATDGTSPAGIGLHRMLLAGNQLSVGPKVADLGAGAGAQWFSPAGANGTMIAYVGNTHLRSIDVATGVNAILGDAPDVAGVDGAACANGISLTKDAAPRTVTAGTELTYTYRITSRALVNAPLSFVDVLPAGMTYVPGSVTRSPAFGTVTPYGGTNRLAISGTIAPQQTVTITARVRVAPEHACNVNADNQAQATLSVGGLPPVAVDSNDPDTPTDPDDATRVRVTCAADVSVVKSASTSPIVPGEEATFELVATNDGPSTARNVAVSDDLPDDLTFVSASEECAEAAGTVTCAVAALAPGASQTFTVTGRVASSLDACLENTATVTGAVPDPNAANNASTICTPIRGRSDLSMTKEASRSTVPSAGGQVMYTLVVRNAGPSDDTGVEVDDALPAGLTLVSAQPSQGSCSTAGNRVACDLGTLRDGGSAQVLVTANVAGRPGCVTNTARVRGARQDPDGDDNSASARVCVGPPPDPRFDLEVVKRAGDRDVLVGQRVTYRIEVRNNGPQAAPGVRVTDTLNARVSVVSVRTTAGSCTRRLPVRCELGTIAAADTVTITIVAKHREASRRQRNAASATGEGTDTTPGNNLDTVDVRVRKVALRLSKVASSSVVRAGGTLSYRIRVQNPTRGEATNVRVCDRLPSGMRFISSTPRGSSRGAQRCWTVGRLGARSTRTFRVTVRVARGANGRKTNRATASSRDVATERARRAVRVLGVATPVTG